MALPDDPVPAEEIRPWPIVANLGGPIDPADHVGHEAELEEVVRASGGVGALVTGDRRMGKTSLLLKAQQYLGTSHVVLKISAETENSELFASRLLAAMRGHRIFADELDRWSLSVDVGYKGIRLRRDSPGAAEDSDDLFAWAARRAAPGRLIVILDEITVLASAIERGHPGGALEFLRSLRRPRQELDNLAIILSGSVGLHHSVPDNSPINDLQKIRVGPLATEDAVLLARCLLLGGEIAVSNEMVVARAMVDASDGIPYYVHHLARAASVRGGTLTPAVIGELRQAALTDPDDPWNLRHYRDRLSGYYGDRAELVAHILDAFAKVDRPLDVDELAGALGAVDLDRRPKRDELVELVEKIESDYYLVRKGSTDEFASRILRDAWLAMRRL